MIQGLVVNAYICDRSTYDIDYSRQLSANQGAAGDSTDVLDPGVASPFFSSETPLNLEDSTSVADGGRPLLLPLHPLLDDGDLLLDGYGSVLGRLHQLVGMGGGGINARS